METETLKQEIDALIAVLGEENTLAKPDAERAVLEQIRAILDQTREQRTGDARPLWEAYLPYAAKLCARLARLEEGWEDALEFFASENAQFWLDNAGALLERGDIANVGPALGQVHEATRMLKQDWITRVGLLLQALEIALEISDKKRAIQLFEAAEKDHRKHLASGDQYTGSAWLPKIKKMGRQLAGYREKLRRYYHYAETVTVAIEAASAEDLEHLLDYLLQKLPGKIKVTRRAQDTEPRARIKVTLE